MTTRQHEIEKILRRCNWQTLLDFMPIIPLEQTTSYKKSMSHIGERNINYHKPRPPHIQAILKKFAHTVESSIGEKNSFYGKHHSDSFKKQRGELISNLWKNPEWRKNILDQWKQNKHGYNVKGMKRSELTKQKIRDSMKDRPRKYRNTKPERMVQIALMLRGIKFTRHKIFKVGKSYHEVDIFIEPNIIIEVDGVKWHIPKKQLIRDLEINAELTIQGYFVLRIRDKDILKNNGIYLENILKLINLGREIPNLREVI